MTTTISGQLVEKIDEAVRAVPGVERVYRPGHFAAALRDAGAALGIGPAGETTVRTTLGESGVVVEASIGIDGSARAADVLERVRAAIAAVLDGEQILLDMVALTIAHVSPHEAAHR
jgi:hypothetical protein